MLIVNRQKGLLV